MSASNCERRQVARQHVVRDPRLPLLRASPLPVLLVGRFAQEARFYTAGRLIKTQLHAIPVPDDDLRSVAGFPAHHTAPAPVPIAMRRNSDIPELLASRSAAENVVGAAYRDQKDCALELPRPYTGCRPPPSVPPYGSVAVIGRLGGHFYSIKLTDC